MTGAEIGERRSTDARCCRVLSSCSYIEYAPEAGNNRQSWELEFSEGFHGVAKKRAEAELDMRAGTKGTSEQVNKGPRERGAFSPQL
jgi:hypothetical protein